MKSGNYDERVRRFFAGTASPQEISILKAEGVVTRDDELYAAALQAEREQKMDWSFDAFMEEAKPAKVVALPQHTRWVKKIAAAAAVAALLVSTYLFWPQHKHSGEMAVVPVKEQAMRMDPKNNAGAKPKLAAAKIAPVKKPAIVSKENTKKAVPVYRNVKDMPAPVIDSLPAAEPFMVIVNGKPVTNREEAIAIAGKSMAIFSRSLAQTIEELKPIAQIKIKL